MCGPLVPAVPPCILDPLREEFLALIPARVDRHPLGCHRRRIDDRVVFEKLVAGLPGGRVVLPEPLGPAQAEDPTVDPLNVPHAWVVHRGPRPEVQEIDDALVTSAARQALRQLLDLVPAADWHIVSTVRSDLQHWLSR